MNGPDDNTVTIKLRIPGQWKQPQELVDRLPAECQFKPESLIFPDGTEVGFSAVGADDQFAQIFRSSCRQLPEPSEMAIVQDYTANVLLTGPGGSMAAAQKMMEAAATIVRAGGAGVFIDNSALAHGGQNWLAMTEDGGSDALSFAFAAIIRGRTEVFTMGMHALGLRDVVMTRADAEQEGFGIVDVIRYLARGDKSVDDRHILIDLEGPRFQAFLEAGDQFAEGSPMHNPFGRLKLVSMKDLAERN